MERFRRGYWRISGRKGVPSSRIMPSEDDKAKAAQLKREVEALRWRRNAPSTPRAERSRLKLQIETRIWQGQRLDPEQFKTYRWRS